MMTQEEILEFNKRCAEFLKIPNLKDYKGDAWDFKRTGHLIYTIRTSELRFHSDWNLIMEVVEAIEKIGETSERYGVIVDITTTHVNIRYSNIRGRSSNFIVDFKLQPSDKKDAVVSVMNDFLIWYNENKIN